MRDTAECRLASPSQISIRVKRKRINQLHEANTRPSLCLIAEQCQSAPNLGFYALIHDSTISSTASHISLVHRDDCCFFAISTKTIHYYVASLYNHSVWLGSTLHFFLAAKSSHYASPSLRFTFSTKPTSTDERTPICRTLSSFLDAICQEPSLRNY